MTKNFVDHGNGEGEQLGTVSVAIDGERPEYFSLHMHQTSGSEFNIDVAVAFFPFSHWQGGIAFNSVNGGRITNLLSSPGINLGAEFIDNGNGRFSLLLPGVDASANAGVLLVSSAESEDNFALSAPEDDGSFTIYSHDNGRTGGSYEQDSVAFVYVPVGTSGVTLGRIHGDGSIEVSSGEFEVSVLSPGVFLLEIPCGSPQHGTLIVSAEGGGSSNIDNIITYEWNPTSNAYTVMSRDLPDASPQHVDKRAFSFAFVAFPGSIHV